MAESFLEEIYKDAFTIQLLRESTEALYRSNHVEAMEKYNQAATNIESMISRLVCAERSKAELLERTALDIQEHWRDTSYVTGRISANMIPLIYDFISNFTGIDIKDGDYSLESSRSGFLTIRDDSKNFYIHDTDDPMWEATRIVDSIYRPEASKYLIFGCGLGYLPYVIWRRSGGTVSLTVYEDDEKILNYARRFGVLEKIPATNLDVVYVSNKEKLLERFGKDYDSRGKYDEVYITKWKDKQFADVNNGSLSYLYEILTFNRYVEDIITTNIRVNHGMKKTSIDRIRERLETDEWIVVAAGPSLDYNMDFLQGSVGKRRIVVVNTAVKRLANEGIVPDLVVAADTNERLLKHIEGVEDFTKDIPLIADEATSWKYTAAYKGEKCFVPTPAGQGITISNPEHMEVWDIMGTVTSLAVEAAIRLAAKKIYLLGLDLGYPGGQNYAKGMPHETMSNKKGIMKVRSVDGSTIETSAAFNLFRMGIEQKIAENKDVTFINMSKHGAYIEGAKSYE